MTRTTAEIAEIVDGEIIGDGSLRITGVANIEDAKKGDVTFALNGKYLNPAYDSKASAIIVSHESKIKSENGRAFIKASNPRLAFIKVLELFAPQIKITPGVHSTAIIGQEVILGKNISIGPYAVIRDGVKVGDGVALYAHVYVGERVEIGGETTIYPQVTLCRGVKIGKKVIIHSGSVIGSDGFGYIEVNKKHLKIPQNGSVLIGDEVEIGANVTIDRATTGTTSIGRGTKIDNQVMIAHNVTIGEDCIIIAQVGISGSVKLEDSVTLAGQVGVAGHLTIGANTVVAARSGITKSIKPNQFISGYPARPHSEEKRIKAAISRLPVLLKRVRELEQKVEELEKTHKD